MGLYNFKRQFEARILLWKNAPDHPLAKAHTIRAPRKGGREDKPGSTMHLYVGLRQSGAHRIIDPVKCVKRESVVIKFPRDLAFPAMTDAEIHVGEFLEDVLDDEAAQKRVIANPSKYGLQMLSDDECESLASHDGFGSAGGGGHSAYSEMMAFWQAGGAKAESRLPFYGHIFHWGLLKEKGQ